MDNSNRKNIFELVFFIVTLILLIAGIALIFNSFGNNLTSAVNERNEKFIRDSTVDIRNSLDNNFSRGLDNINAFAYLFEQSEESPKYNHSILKTVEDEGQFDIIRYIDSQGNDYTSNGPALNSDGKPIDLSDRVYFTKAMKGESGICAVQSSKLTGESIIVFYAPVVHGNERGVLLGAYDESSMNRLLSKKYFGYKSDVLLIDRSGTILMMSVTDTLKGILRESSDPKKVDSVLNNRSAMNRKNAKAIKYAFANMSPASFTYTGKYGKGMGYYVNLKSTDLLLGQTFPSGAVRDMNKSINYADTTLKIRVILIFSLYGILVISYLTFKNMNLNSRFSEQYIKARRDVLTGLRNRLAFEEDCIGIEENRLAGRYSVISADLNELKTTNDTLGHHAGDELITGAAQILQSCFTQYGAVYRTGGDEFIALVSGNSYEIENALLCFAKKQENWRGKYCKRISIAIGTASGEQDNYKSIYKLIKEADLAMYNNKKEVKGYE